MPIAKPGLPVAADVTLITNSGADVPKATIVSPITISGTPQRRASADAPSVSIFAPPTINTSPANSINMLVTIYSFIFSFIVSSVIKNAASSRRRCRVAL